MNRKGFTLVEIIVVLVIVAILATVAIGIVNNKSGSISKKSFSYGINGMTESRCIEGYKFIISQDGSSRQIMDENGKGIKCQ